MAEEPAPTASLDGLDEEAVARLAEDVAALLRPGDLVALSGDLGAGKTVFARAVIRYRAGDPCLDVPSPTFALRIDYPGLDIVHADLYRIGGVDEIEELGLEEALETGIVLLEWQERARPAATASGHLLEVSLSGEGEHRNVRLAGSRTWPARLERLTRARGLIEAAGFGDAGRSPVTGDVSGRAYRRLVRDGGTALLMDAPPRQPGPPVHDGRSFEEVAHRALTVAPFVAIARALRAGGVHAPEVVAADIDAGLLVIEDFGDETIAGGCGKPVPERYETAIDLLAAMHARSWPDSVRLPGGGVHAIPPYDRGALLAELTLFPDFFAGIAAGPPFDAQGRRSFLETWSRVLGDLADARHCWVLLDFHSPNLMWRQSAEGTDRIGVLDFQDALIGHPAYDMASLAQDVRVAMPPDLERRLKARYCARRQNAGSFDRRGFNRAYTVFAAQRATKVLGAFSRLVNQGGRREYRPFIGNALAVLRRTLADPVLSPLRLWYQPYLGGGADV